MLVSAYALFSTAVLVALALFPVPTPFLPVVVGSVVVIATLPVAGLFLAPRPNRLVNQPIPPPQPNPEDMLAEVCHEIRTSLNAVLGFSELLEHTHLDATQASYMSSIRESGAHLLSVVGHALEHGKAEAGHESEERDVDLVDLVAGGLRALSPAAQAKGLTLEATPWIGPVAARLDPVRLRQVLLNLLANAIKFTSTGKVTVTGSAHPDGAGRVRLRLAVHDTGIGMSPSQLEELFVPYHQVGPEETRQGGTGLGLVISRDLCRRMGGDLTVTSQAGRGSTFVATALAGVARGRPKPAVPHSPWAEPTLSSKPHPSLSILLVEDDLMNQKLGLKILEALGYQADTAGDGVQAVQKVERGHYDVVLLDVQMPLMNGLEAAAAMRRLPVQRPFIVGLTASALPGDRERCLAAGMDDYLPKPLDPQQLARLLAAIAPAPANLAA